MPSSKCPTLWSNAILHSSMYQFCRGCSSSAKFTTSFASSKNLDSITTCGALDLTLPACIVPTFASTQTAQSVPSSSWLDHQRAPVKPSTLPLCPSQVPYPDGLLHWKIPWPIWAPSLPGAGCHRCKNSIAEGLSNLPSRRAVASLRISEGDEIIPPATHSTERLERLTPMRSLWAHCTRVNPGHIPAVWRNVLEA